MIRFTLKRDESTATSNTNGSSDVTTSANATTNQPQQPKLRINLSTLNTTASSTVNTNSTITSSTNQNQNIKQLPSSGGAEEQFILRLPPSLASILSTELSENDYTLPGDLVIQFVSPRCALVQHPRFIKSNYAAVLVDAPTVMETFKSSTINITNISRNDTVVEEDDQDTSAETSTENDHLCTKFNFLLLSYLYSL